MRAPAVTLTLAIRMLRNAECEVDSVLRAIADGCPPSPERLERVHRSYLEARAIAARAHEMTVGRSR